MAEIQDLVTAYGYIALYGLLAAGIVGLPIPDETLMVLAGSLVSLGTFDYTTTIAVCFAGSMSGMFVSYAIGRKLGKPVLYRYGRRVRLTPKRLARAEAWFHKYGVWTVAFGYFLPGLRHLSCYLAGVSGIGLRRYLCFAGGGALVWCLTFVTVGYYVGEHWETILRLAHRYAGGITTVLLAAIGVAVYLIYRSRGRKAP